MKRVIFGAFVAGALVLSGCGEGETEVEKKEATVSTEQEEVKNDKEKAIEEQVVLDNDQYMVKVVDFVVKEDSFSGQEAKVILEVENKTDQTIEVQSREGSVDGEMFDDAFVLSETVAPGKTAKMSLSLSEMWLDEDAQEFPEFNDYLETNIVLLDDGFQELESVPLRIDF